MLYGYQKGGTPQTDMYENGLKPSLKLKENISMCELESILYFIDFSNADPYSVHNSY